MASSIYTSRPQRTHCAAAVHRSLPDLSLASFLRSSKTPNSLRTSSVNLIIQTVFKKAVSALWQPLRLGCGRASTSSVVSCGPQATSLSKMDLVHGLFCWVVCTWLLSAINASLQGRVLLLRKYPMIYQDKIETDWRMAAICVSWTASRGAGKTDLKKRSIILYKEFKVFQEALRRLVAVFGGFKLSTTFPLTP